VSAPVPSPPLISAALEERCSLAGTVGFRTWGLYPNAAYLRERPRDAEAHAASEQPGGCPATGGVLSQELARQALIAVWEG